MDLDSFDHLAALFEAGLTNAVSELNPERAFVAYRGRSTVPSEYPTPYATHGFSMAGLYLNEDISTKVISQTLREGKNQLIVDAISTPGLTNRTSVVLSGLRSILTVPLRYSNGLTVGLLYVDNRIKAGAFQESHETVLTETAAQLVERLASVESKMKAAPKGGSTEIPLVESRSKALGLAEKGQYTEALATIESWIQGREDSEELGMAHGVRGRILQQMGQTRSAFEAVSIAVFLLGQTATGANEHYALMLNNLAGLHVDMGHLHRAHGLLTASSAYWSRLAGKDERHYAGLSATYYNLGKLHTEMGHPTESKQWYEQALRCCQDHFGVEHPRTQKVREALSALS